MILQPFPRFLPSTSDCVDEETAMYRFMQSLIQGGESIPDPRRLAGSQSRVPLQHFAQSFPVHLVTTGNLQSFQYAENGEGGSELAGLRFKGMHEYRANKLLFKTAPAKYMLLRSSVNTVDFSQYSSAEFLDAFRRLKTDRPTNYLTAQEGWLKSNGQGAYWEKANQDQHFCVIKANDSLHSLKLNSPVKSRGSYFMRSVFYLPLDSDFGEEGSMYSIHDYYLHTNKKIQPTLTQMLGEPKMYGKEWSGDFVCYTAEAVKKLSLWNMEAESFIKKHRLRSVLPIGTGMFQVGLVLSRSHSIDFSPLSKNQLPLKEHHTDSRFRQQNTHAINGEVAYRIAEFCGHNDPFSRQTQTSSTKQGKEQRIRNESFASDYLYNQCTCGDPTQNPPMRPLVKNSETKLGREEDLPRAYTRCPVNTYSAIVCRAAAQVVMPDINSEAMETLEKTVSHLRKLIKQNILQQFELPDNLLSVDEYHASLEPDKAQRAIEAGKKLQERLENGISLISLQQQACTIMAKHNEENIFRDWYYLEDSGGRARLIVAAESLTKAVQGPVNKNTLTLFKQAFKTECVHMSADCDILQLGQTLVETSDIQRPNVEFGTSDFSSFDATVGHALMLLIAYGLKDLFDHVLEDFEFRTTNGHFLSTSVFRKELNALIFNQDTLGACRMAPYQSKVGYKVNFMETRFQGCTQSGKPTQTTLGNSFLTTALNLVNFVMCSGSIIDEDGNLSKSDEFIDADPRAEVKGDDSLITTSSVKFMDKIAKNMSKLYPTKKTEVDKTPYFGIGVVCDGIIRDAQYLSLKIKDGTASRQLVRILRCNQTTSLAITAKDAYELFVVSQTKVLEQWDSGYLFREIKGSKVALFKSLLQGVHQGEGRAAMTLRKLTGVNGASYKYARTAFSSALKISRTFGYSDVETCDLEQVHQNAQLLMYAENAVGDTLAYRTLAEIMTGERDKTYQLLRNVFALLFVTSIMVSAIINWLFTLFVSLWVLCVALENKRQDKKQKKMKKNAISNYGLYDQQKYMTAHAMRALSILIISLFFLLIFAVYITAMCCAWGA